MIQLTFERQLNEEQREFKPFQPSRQEKSYKSNDFVTTGRSVQSSGGIRQKDDRLFHQWKSGARRTTPQPEASLGEKENWWGGIPQIPGTDLLRHYSQTFENEISPVLAGLNPAARTEDISQPRSDTVLAPRIGSGSQSPHEPTLDPYLGIQNRPRTDVRSFPKPLYSGFVPVTAPPSVSAPHGSTPLSLFSSVPENIDEHGVFDLSRHVEFGTR